MRKGRTTAVDRAVRERELLDELSLEWDARDTVVEMVRYLLGSGYPRFEHDAVRRKWAEQGLFTPVALIEAVNRGIDRTWTKSPAWWEEKASKLSLNTWIQVLATQGLRKRAYTQA